MHEYRSKPLDRVLLLAELSELCTALQSASVLRASVSFGLNSDLSFDDMWKSKTVAVDDLVAFIAAAETSGAAQIGKSDVFIEASAGKLDLIARRGAEPRQGVHIRATSRW